MAIIRPPFLRQRKTSLTGFRGRRWVGVGSALELAIPVTAGFSGSDSGITSLAGFGARRPQPLNGGSAAIPATFSYALAVPRQILVACWMRRSDHPSRPRAKTCCFFASFKTLAMPTEPTSLREESMSRTLLSVAGFQVITIGRFWVIAEAKVLASPPTVVCFWCASWMNVWD
jgi:hypothetical protein